MQPRIDLDHNATTPIEPEVIAAVEQAMREIPANPSSRHAEGRRARASIEEARGKLARLIGAVPEEIVFTSGGTEANNLALETCAAGMRPLVLSAVEHPSVLRKARNLEERGCLVRFVRPDRQGAVSAAAVFEALDATPGAALVSLMLANNETGCLQPVDEVAAAIRMKDCRLHTDAVQALGKIHVDVRRLGADLATFSSHKIGGPKGIGALWARDRRFPRPLLLGGEQEWGVRAGTENVAGIVGFGVAAELAARRGETDRIRIAALRDRLEGRVLAAVPGSVALCSGAGRLPNTTLIAFEGVEAYALVQLLDIKGILCSTGAACRAHSDEASHVLLAMEVPLPLARGAVRFSLGSHATGREMDRAAERIAEAVMEMTGADLAMDEEGER